MSAKPNPTILVIDDSENLREVYISILEAAGYDVRTAENGADGFAQALGSSPDLIVSDGSMPVMDGLELLQRLQSELPPPRPPVLLCSGFEMTEEEATRRGAFACLRKPFERSDLLEFVACAIERRRVSPESEERVRQSAQAARQARRRSASARVDDIQAYTPSLPEVLSPPLDWLRAYFGFDRAAVLLVEDGRLRLAAQSHAGAMFPLSADAATARECQDVVESGSTLVVSDLRRHPCFGGVAELIPDARFFAGLPLTDDDGTPIGMVCVSDRRQLVLAAEDLTILGHLAQRGSLLTGQVAEGDGVPDVPGCFGGGVLTREMFGRLIALELELLRRDGGSLALAFLDGVAHADLYAIADALGGAGHRERLAAGVSSGGTVVLCQRDRGDDARLHVGALLQTLVDTRGPFRAVGIVELGGSGLPAFTGVDLLRVGELALERAMETGDDARITITANDSDAPLAFEPP